MINQETQRYRQRDLNSISLQHTCDCGTEFVLSAAKCKDPTFSRAAQPAVLTSVCCQSTFRNYAMLSTKLPRVILPLHFA